MHHLKCKALAKGRDNRHDLIKKFEDVRSEDKCAVNAVSMLLVSCYIEDTF